jgi:hypothetical protein
LIGHDFPLSKWPALGRHIEVARGLRLYHRENSPEYRRISGKYVKCGEDAVSIKICMIA